MLDKIKNNLINYDWNNLRDVRFLVLLGFGAIGLLTTWSAIKTVGTNYNLQQQIGELQRQNQISKLENDNLKLKNQYYQTDTYLELTARQQFNKGLEGEKLVIVPEEAIKNHLPKVANKTDDSVVESPKRFYQKNWQAWMDFLFRQED